MEAAFEISKAPTPAELETFIKTFDWKGPVGISFPTVIKNGKAMQYGNLDKSWQYTQIDTLFKSKTIFKAPVSICLSHNSTIELKRLH